MRKLLLSLWCLLAGTTMLFAQSQPWPGTNTQALRQMSVRFDQEYKEQVAQAVEIAKRRVVLGDTTLRKFVDVNAGKVYGLQQVYNGVPIFNEINGNLFAANTTRASAIWEGGRTGLNLNGEGITFGVWEAFDETPTGQLVAAVLPTHQELAGRVFIKDGAALPGGFGANHGTHVAGTIGAVGVSSAARGMGNKYIIHSYDVNSDNAEMAAAAADGMLISQHSYGIRTSTLVNAGLGIAVGAYVLGAREWDEIMYNAPYYFPVKSAGNERTAGFNAGGVFGTAGWNLLTGNANSKNVLVVGAVNMIPNGYATPADVVMSSFSSWGPTDDGRIKPDISAAGVNIYSPIGNSPTAYGVLSGTSMSGPNASGSLGLLQQLHMRLTNGMPMRSATLRGLAIHAADEAGTTPGPDYRFGWGLLNVERAANMITSVREGRQNHIMEELTLQNGQSYEFQVVASGREPLRLTIVWTDVPGPLLTSITLNDPTPMLINDLDIRATDGSVMEMPWVLNPASPGAGATRGDNFRDNVEQIVINSPVPGKVYTVRISHKGQLVNGKQDYTLLASGVGGGAYCASGAAVPRGLIISNVTIGSSSFSSSDCASYTLNSAPVSVAPGQTLPLSVTIGQCMTTNVLRMARAYADWNADGDFDDDGELLGETAQAFRTPGIGINTTFTVPDFVPPGAAVKMRIVAREVPTGNPSASLISPCGEYPNGETEDFVLQVASAQRDIEVLSVIPNISSCPSTPVTFVVSMRNRGSASVSNIPVSVRLEGPSMGTLSGIFTGTIGIGQTGVFQVPGSLVLSAGQYRAIAEASLAGDINAENNIAFGSFTQREQDLSFTPQALACSGGVSNVLRAQTTPGNNVFWYTQPTGGTLLGAGNNVPLSQAQLNNLPVPNTVYAGLNQFSSNFGIEVGSPQANATVFSSFNGSQWFVVETPFRLSRASIRVNFSAGTTSGSMTFALTRLGDGQVISERVISVQPGWREYDLNIDFPVGTYDFTMTFSPGVTAGLNIGGMTALYPFTIPGIVTMPSSRSATGGSVAHTPQNGSRANYLYLYSMRLEAIGCAAPSRVPVPFEFNFAPPVTATINGPQALCLGETTTLSAPAGGTAYRWFRDGVLIPGQTGQQLVVTNTGTPNLNVFLYRVEVTHATGCASLSPEVSVFVFPGTPPVKVVSLQPSGCTGTPFSRLLYASHANADVVGYQWYRNGSPLPSSNSLVFNATMPGSYTVELVGFCSSAFSEPLVVENVTPVISSISGLACDGGNVSLSAQTNTPATVFWYSRNNDFSSFLGRTGSSVQLPPVSGPTTFFAAANNFSGSLPIESVNGLTWGFTGGFFIDAAAPFTLQSAVVGLRSGAGGGTFEVELYDPNDVFIQGVSFPLPANLPLGFFNVPLNLYFPEAGNNYQIFIYFTGTAEGFNGSRAAPGFPYPYTIPGVVTLKPGPFGPTWIDYLEEWEIRSAGCSSPFVPVTVTPGTTPQPVITANGPAAVAPGGSLLLSATPTGAGLTYRWFRNGNLISGATAATFSANMTGLYTVEISNNGCVGTSQPFAVSVLDNSVLPMVSAIRINDGGTLDALFGYQNDNILPVSIPAGPRNFFTPNPQNRNQPETFLPGTYEDVVAARILGANAITWSVTSPNGLTNTATARRPVGMIEPQIALVQSMGNGRFGVFFRYENQTGLRHIIESANLNRIVKNGVEIMSPMVTQFLPGTHSAGMVVVQCGDIITWEVTGPDLRRRQATYRVPAEQLATAPSRNAVFRPFSATASTISGQILPGDGAKRIVIARESTLDPRGLPVNGREYVSGDMIGGNLVVYVGEGTSFVHTGLAPGATYQYAVYEFNGSDCGVNYLLRQADVRSVRTLILGARLDLHASAEAQVEEATMEDAAFEVFPNPSADVVTFRYKAVDQAIRLTIYNALGQVVMTKTATDVLEERMDFSTHAVGLYVAKVSVGDRVVTRKFVIE